MPRSCDPCFHEPVPVWYRLWYYWRSSSHGRLPGGDLKPRSSTIIHVLTQGSSWQVFGYPSDLSPIGYNIATDVQQLISSLMTLGAFIASSTAGFTAVYMGRKMSLWVACVGIFVSTAIMQSTTNIAGLYAGRLLIGLANGLLMTHSQLYIQVGRVSYDRRNPF